MSGGKLAEELEAGSDELEEELFADTSAIQEALDYAISSYTVVTVECKQKRVTNVHVLCLFWYKGRKFHLNLQCRPSWPS